MLSNGAQRSVETTPALVRRAMLLLDGDPDVSKSAKKGGRGFGVVGRVRGAGAVGCMCAFTLIGDSFLSLLVLVLNLVRFTLRCVFSCKEDSEDRATLSKQTTKNSHRLRRSRRLQCCSFRGCLLAESSWGGIMGLLSCGSHTTVTHGIPAHTLQRSSDRTLEGPPPAVAVYQIKSMSSARERSPVATVAVRTKSLCLVSTGCSPHHVYP